MAWFKRSKEHITTDTPKKDISDGTWVKCDECGEMIHRTQWESNYYICNNSFQELCSFTYYVAQGWTRVDNYMV